MSNPAEKLIRAENLIISGYKQDGALLLRQILQEHPNSWQAWELLSKVTVGQAHALCLQKAAELKPKESPTLISIPDPANEDTQPYIPAEAIQATAPATVAPLDQTNVRPAPEPAASPSPVGQSRFVSSLRYWGAIAVSGVILGCLIIFLLNLFTPVFNAQSDALAANDLENDQLIAAVFETATPTPTLVIETEEETDGVAELLPTNTPAANQQSIAKAIGEDGQTRDVWTPTPTPTPTFTPTPTIEPTKVLDSSYTSFNLPPIGANERWVDVNLSLQTLTAFEGKTPVYQTIISSGRPPYYTVTGQFRVYYRLEEQTMDGRRLGFDYVTPGVPHVQYFYGDFAIHGAYWHDNFGTPVSHGCVNVTPADAEWLYNWMSYGTLVNVHY